MKSTPLTNPPDASDATFQMVTEIGNELSAILADTTQELWRFQSDYFASGFADCLASIVPLFAPGSQDYFFSAMPALYESQSGRSLKALLDSGWTLSRTQQRIFDWQVRALSRQIGERIGVVED